MVPTKPPGRFLKIPDGASSVYHFSGRLRLPYIDLVQDLSMQVSVLLDILFRYLQLVYLSDSLFCSVVAFIIIYKCKSLIFY